MGHHPKPSSYKHMLNRLTMMRIALTGSRASHPNQTYGMHFFVINKEKN